MPGLWPRLALPRRGFVDDHLHIHPAGMGGLQRGEDRHGLDEDFAPGGGDLSTTWRKNDRSRLAYLRVAFGKQGSEAPSASALAAPSATQLDVFPAFKGLGGGDPCGLPPR